MKKTIFLLTSLIIILAAGCNEKNLVKNIEGTWHVQKYTVDGADRTHWFDTTYPYFVWSFTSDMKFYRSWATHLTGTVYTVDTVSHYDSVSQMVVIDAINSTSAVVPYNTTHFVRGDWLLTNGNKYLQTRDTIKNTQYEVLDHSSSNLHLLTGNEEYYLSQ